MSRTFFRLPTIRGIIDRRILVNFRVDPDVAARQLPAPFRPKLARGLAMAGICLIRLKGVRPALLPYVPGLSSENAAHRFAVEWEPNGRLREGVFIPRRDTSSRLNALAGGRLFPGEHHRAQFKVAETGDRLSIEVNSSDRQVHIRVDASEVRTLPAGSIFESVDEASRFFERGSLGYSVTTDIARFDGLELDCKHWSVRPLAVERVESSYFDNPAVFPPGAARFDCALLMRDVPHEWHSREDLCCAPVDVHGLPCQKSSAAIDPHNELRP